ncbi:PHP domain-containing protein [Anaerosinus gibii]|uniref:PHP domain-containing protein n=1 Tax=Selenobaculum gibii TaxID=3054208 RepID=A0A9Y2AGU0_9FIRM|nr:PHP domain-containing protein [Selenobaculum gbiensis]WIW69683.1 PHP domain-containing protein [Selenobaculum gbiensis]
MASDLHIHTIASDGRLSPQEVVQLAIKNNLKYIAITDHDTLNGLLKLDEKNLLYQESIKIIRGIEFSADMPSNEVHILGYHIDLYYPPLKEKLKSLVDARWNRLDNMIKKLNSLGYIIKKEEVLEIAGDTTSIGRAHIARCLVEKGYFKRLGEIFDQLLGKNCPAYEPHAKLTCEEIIQLVSRAGGVSIIAHPGMIGDDKIVHHLIALGISGIEVFHPKHSPEEVIKYMELAKKNNLFITGGSDYHAIKTRYPEKLGMFTIDDIWAEILDKKSC